MTIDSPVRKTLSGTIAANLTRQIRDGLIPARQKLPSIRELAKAYGCSKNTVISAYDTVVAAGLIEPRQGAGYFVLENIRTDAANDEPTTLARAMDMVWLIREQLISKPDHLNLGEGFPPVDWLQEIRVDQIHYNVVRSASNSLFRYGSRFGYLPLRQLLQRKLAAYEIGAAPGQIVMTHGANQAMDMVIRQFVRPGQHVLVDDPGYYMLFGKLALAGAEIVGVPRLHDGPDLDRLEQLLKSLRPKLFFTQSVGHNPTGSDTSATKAHRLLQLAAKYDLIIVENDVFADFKPRTATRLSALDQLERTIYIGSFSKSVSAALRVGFVACHPTLASDLADIKTITHISTCEYSERTLATILSQGHYLRHVSHLRDKLTYATAHGIEVLHKLGAEIFKENEQSLYLWAALPGITDSIAFAQTMLERKIILAPGAIFSPQTGLVTPWCRFNVTYLDDPRVAGLLMS